LLESKRLIFATVTVLKSGFFYPNLSIMYIIQQQGRPFHSDHGAGCAADKVGKGKKIEKREIMKNG
jgi:hypothetical protein